MNINRFADVGRPTSDTYHARRTAPGVVLDNPLTKGSFSERQPDASRWFPRDWDLACAGRVNVFLIGGDDATRILVSTLGSYLKQPVVTVHAGGQLTLPPAGQVGTLILYDVSALALADQRRVLEWLEGNRSTQVISTSPTSIVSRLAADTFLERLYYRLNTLYYEVASVSSSGPRPQQPQAS